MCRVLVVDDQAESRAPLGELFASEGFEVSFAADGYQAIDELLRQRPDVIVSDVVMPGLDGIRLVELLRGQGVRLPVILITAGIVHSRHHADALLHKPVGIDVLLECVGDVLRDRAGCCAAICRHSSRHLHNARSAGPSDAEGYA